MTIPKFREIKGRLVHSCPSCGDCAVELVRVSSEVQNSCSTNKDVFLIYYCSTCRGGGELIIDNMGGEIVVYWRLRNEEDECADPL